MVLRQFRKQTSKFSRPDPEFRDLLFLRRSHACPPKSLGIARLHAMDHVFLNFLTAFVPSNFCETGASNDVADELFPIAEFGFDPEFQHSRCMIYGKAWLLGNLRS